MTITYNTFKFPGEFVKYVTVSTDVRGQEEVVITLSGFVEEAPMGKILVEPRKANLGVMHLHAVRNQTYAIRNVGNAPLTISRIYSKKSHAVYFDKHKSGPMVIGPGKTRHIEIAFKADKPGRFVELVYIACDARNSTKEGYKIVATGQVEK